MLVNIPYMEHMGMIIYINFPIISIISYNFPIIVPYFPIISPMILCEIPLASPMAPSRKPSSCARSFAASPLPAKSSTTMTGLSGTARWPQRRMPRVGDEKTPRFGEGFGSGYPLVNVYIAIENGHL